MRLFVDSSQTRSSEPHGSSRRSSRPGTQNLSKDPPLSSVQVKLCLTRYVDTPPSHLCLHFSLHIPARCTAPQRKQTILNYRKFLWGIAALLLGFLSLLTTPIHKLWRLGASCAAILLSSALARSGWGGFDAALVVGLHVRKTSILGSALFSMVLL
jgi:hypothetical protein